jgi:DNA-binding CsgD family transcriptional regulator
MATAPSVAQLSELIGSIYDRAVDPAAWDDTLARMRTFLGAGNAALGLFDLRTKQPLISYFENIPDYPLANIERWGREIIGLWGGPEVILALPMSEPAILSRVNPSAGKGANSYRDAFVSAGYVDAMALGLARDNHVIGSCIFGRTKSDGWFREEEIALARLLAPHAQRAISFSRMFELATLRANAFEAALDAAAVPTILVSDQAELIHANAAGHEELDRGESLRLQGNRIRTADLAHQVGLSRALETARDRPDCHPDHLNLDLDGGNRQLKFLPLPLGTVRGTLAPSAAAAICLSGPVPSPPRDDSATAKLLIARHGLTRSEAAVALEVAKGDGRAAAAARLGIRDNTVRTHLSSIFHKLDINRQAQLVRLIDEVANGHSGKNGAFAEGP